jgi:hypothetical protein
MASPSSVLFDEDAGTGPNAVSPVSFKEVDARTEGCCTRGCSTKKRTIKIVNTVRQDRLIVFSPSHLLKQVMNPNNDKHSY